MLLGAGHTIVKKVVWYLPQVAHMLERPQIDTSLTDDQDSDEGGLRARGRKAEVAWAAGMLGLHHLLLSAGPQSWQKLGSQAHSALLGWEGQSLSPPPLGQLGVLLSADHAGSPRAPSSWSLGDCV